MVYLDAEGHQRYTKGVDEKLVARQRRGGAAAAGRRARQGHVHRGRPPQRFLLHGETPDGGIRSRDRNPPSPPCDGSRSILAAHDSTGTPGVA